MRSIKVLRKQILLILLVAFFVLPSTAPSTAKMQFGLNQERISEAQWSRGFHGFNMIAEGNDLERINLQQFQSAISADVLLIVIGRLDQLPINVTNHVNNGGAALLASDSSVPYSEASFAGFRFAKLKNYPTKDSDAFGGMKDCPVVSDFIPHPTVSGVGEIVTNRPGYILANRQTTLARLPSTYQRSRLGAFVAARENRNAGRAVVVGDQSIFTNQMIIYGDNALFANQAVKWLKNGRSKKMLILVDGLEHSALDPSGVAVDVPAPSRREVIDALKDLPPTAMFDFANSVATVVEDEDMINNFIHDSMDKVPELAVRQFYLVLMFCVACFTFVAAFLCQGKLQRKTASVVAVKRSRQQETGQKAVQFHERQQAAYILLDRFCMDFANRRFSDWPSFPTGMNVDEDRRSKNLSKSMTKMSVLYKSKPVNFWTRRKLAQLERTVGAWRAYFEGRSTPVDAELIQNQGLWSTDHLTDEFN